MNFTEKRTLMEHTRRIEQLEAAVAELSEAVRLLAAARRPGRPKKAMLEAMDRSVESLEALDRG